MKHTAIAPTALPGLPAPMPQVARILCRYQRAQVEAFIEIAIAMLDTFEDPDIELNGDEMDASGAEDDFCRHNTPGCLQGPGCPIADPDKGADDEGEAVDEREDEDFVFAEYDIDQSRGPRPLFDAMDRRIMAPHIDRLRKSRGKISSPSNERQKP